jgi:LysW-gamma-L-lysine carboxypeptidase
MFLGERAGEGADRPAGPVSAELPLGDPLGFVAQAVAIPSPSGYEAVLAHHLAERCDPFATNSVVDAAGNLVVDVGTGPLRVLILGHLDTVPGDIPVRREGDTLFGRGSVDAKGPLCCALLAAVRLSASARQALTVSVVGAVEEELPSSRGARHLLATQPEPDLIIIAEPSGWDAVTLGYKGRLRLRLEVEADHRHSSADIPTATEQLLDGIVTLRSFVATANVGIDGVFDRVQLSVTSLEGGNDGLKQRAWAELGFRLPPRFGPDALERRLSELALGSLSVATSGAEIAVRGPRDTVLTRAFRASIRAAGGRPRTKVKTGTSDMNVVAPAWPVPMLAYGPGDALLDHTPDERLEERDLLQALTVLSDVLERLGSTQRPDSS